MLTNILDRVSFIIPSPKRTRAQVLLDAGVYWMERNNFSEAADKLQQCLSACKYGKEDIVVSDEDMDKVVIPALCHLAACNIELLQYTKAVSYCREVLQKRPSHKRALYLQGIANVEMGSFSAAMKYYRRR